VTISHVEAQQRGGAVSSDCPPRATIDDYHPDGPFESFCVSENNELNTALRRAEVAVYGAKNVFGTIQSISTAAIGIIDPTPHMAGSLA
jgi:hypothetical protein